MFGFFKRASQSTVGNYAAVKIEEAGDNLEKYIAGLDPHGVGKAALRQLDQKLDEYTENAAKARQRFNKEQDDVDQIQELFDQRMATANVLNEQASADPDNSALAAKRDEYLAEIEGMVPEVDREISERDHFKDMVEIWETRAKNSASALKNLKKQISNLESGIEMATAKADMAKEKAALAGDKDSLGGLSSAMSAMQSALDDKNAEAEAAEMKAKLITPTSLEDDPIIKAAMEKAAGSTVKSSMSFEERMAALKN